GVAAYLAKVGVEGSNPFARSKENNGLDCRSSAKPMASESSLTNRGYQKHRAGGTKRQSSERRRWPGAAMRLITPPVQAAPLGSRGKRRSKSTYSLMS